MSKTKWYTRALYLVFALALVAGLTLVPLAPTVQASPASAATAVGSNAGGTAVWSTTQAYSGSYSAKLTKDGTGSHGSTYVQFTLASSGITLAGFQTNLTKYSFYHYRQNIGATNGPQFELRFEDTGSVGWVEITAVGLQTTAGGETWAAETLAGATVAGYGGVDEVGTSFFAWTPPLTALSGIEAAVNGSLGVGNASNWVLTRVRVELWETAARYCYVDDITINDTIYDLGAASFVNAADTEIQTVASTGSFYLYVESDTWNASEFAQDTGQVTLKVYDGAGTLVSTNAYTATESGNNTAHFRTPAISGADLGLKPGYKLMTSCPGGATDNSVGYARAEISLDKTYYDVGDTVTIQIKDDTGNASAIDPEVLNVVLDDADQSECGIKVGTNWTELTLDNFIETGNDTGIFQCSKKLSVLLASPGDSIAVYFQNHDFPTTVGTGIDVYDAAANDGTGDTFAEVKATAGVLLQTTSSVAFDKGTYKATDLSGVVTVTDKDKNTSPLSKQTISGNPVVVENVTTGDSITIASLLETDVDAGTFSATIYFGTATGKLPIHDGDQLKATYTDPSDSTDVSTSLAAVGYTVFLYNASDVLVNSYTTITDAEAAVVASDYTIVVKSGYASSDETWPVTVDAAFTGLTIKAEDGATVTINPALKSGVTNEDAFDIDTTYCTIEGFTFKNSYATTTTPVSNSIDAMRGAGTNNLTIKDCTFNLTAGYADDHGINLSTAASNTVTVTGCTFNVGKRAYGIVSTQDEVKFTVKNSTFTGTDCTLAASGWGIDIDGVPGAVNDFLVQNCTFDSLAEAIDINSNAGNVTIRWNTIENSTVATKGAIDMHTNAPKVLIYGNSIEDNTGYSIFSEGAAAGFDDDIDVVFNNITGNAKALKNNAAVTAPKLNAKHNWWGTATGPATTDTTGEVTTTYYLTAPVELTAGYVEQAGATALTLDAHLTAGVKVVANITGNLTYAGVAEYTESPKAALADASFYDAFVDTANAGAAADTVTVSFYTAGLTADSVAYFWNDLSGTWDVCSNQGFNSYEGYIWVLARDQTATVPTYPTIQELTGSMFAISGVPAVLDVPYYDADNSGYIEIDELLNAISDYIGGVPGADINLLLDVISAYINETAV